MKHWIGTCVLEHTACRLYPQRSPLPFLPTGLIDVGMDDKPPGLHISSQERGTWIALSHCCRFFRCTEFFRLVMGSLPK
jgi:hypothetical protein